MKGDINYVESQPGLDKARKQKTYILTRYSAAGESKFYSFLKICLRLLAGFVKERV